MKTNLHTCKETICVLDNTSNRGFWLSWYCPYCKYKKNDKVSSTEWGRDYFVMECHYCQERIKINNPIPIKNKLSNP